MLTIIRLALIPVFIIVYYNGHPHRALAVFCLASFTDMLDGILARKLNQITDFGKLFDPLADKLMVLTALFCQGAAGIFPWEAIIILILSFFHQELVEWGRPLDQYLLWISVGLTIQALISYVVSCWKQLRHMEKKEETEKKE